MNVFERHNIKHLSASSINLYVEQPAKWCLRYLYGVRDDAGPKAWGGHAVEAGLDWFLFRRSDEDVKEVALSKVHARFEEEAGGEDREDINQVRDDLEPMLNRAMEALSHYPEPEARQLTEELWIDGIEVPIKLVIDYVFPASVLDLKCTWRMPSAIPDNHARQVSTYSVKKKKPGALLYVTKAKSKLTELTQEEVDFHFRRLCRNAHSIRALLSICPDKETAASMFCPDYDHPYHWKNEALKTAAMEIWT